MDIRMKVFALTICLTALAGCSVDSSKQRDSGKAAAIHRVEILVLSDGTPLASDIPAPDYDAAASLEDAYVLQRAYKDAMQAAQDKARPLTPLMTLETTKFSVAIDIRNALSAAGIASDGMKFQVLGDAALASGRLEDTLAAAPRASALLVLIPNVLLSPDGRKLRASVEVHLYSRGSDELVAKSAFSASATATQPADPFEYWAADNGAAFSRALAQSGSELGQDVLQLLGN